MNKICTSLEQSKRLIKLGIDVNTADMYHFTIVRDYPYAQGRIATITKIMDGSFSSIYDTPAWSLSALLNLMPETIVPDNGSHQVYQMDVYNYDGLRICEYVGEIDRDSLVGFEKEWFIDAAFEMVCWLKENRKI